jgi:hypothetical protein
MINRFLSSIWGFPVVFFLIGLLWGILRIELILLIPYYYMVAIIVDIGIYLLIGHYIGRKARIFHGKRIWMIFVSPILVYISDRFLAARLLLNLPFAFSVLPPWRLPLESLVIIMVILFSVIGWKTAKISQGKRKESHTG